MAEINATPWQMTVPAELAAECLGAARYALLPASDTDPYIGPTIVAYGRPTGRHRAVVVVDIPAQPSWRTAARVLAPV